MLKIRLQRVGKKNAPSYRVVLAEHTSPPQGKFIEILGHYNPRLKKKGFKKERIEHWLSKGAQPSPTVHNLLVDEKIIETGKLKAWRAKMKKPAASQPEADKQAGPPASTQRGEPQSEGLGGEPKPEEPKPAEEKVEEKPEQVKEEAKEEKKEEGLDKETKID